MSFLDELLQSGVALSSDDPTAIAGVADPGTDPLAAHADHTHPHGPQADPLHHALASLAAHGFMSVADFRKLSATLHVGDFTPGRVALTSLNFEAALNAALAAAYALACNATVRAPGGDWTLGAEVAIRGKGYAGVSTVLRGEGRGMTRLLWPNSYTGNCLYFDGFQSDGDISTHASFFGGLMDIHIQSPGDGGKGVGIMMRNCLWTALVRVSVRGFGNAQNNGINRGIAIWCDGNRPEMSNLQNNQNQNWHDVTVSNSTTGLRSRAGMTAAVKMEFNQNRFCDILCDGSSFLSFRDGMFQSSGYDAEATLNPYFGNPFYALRTWGDTLAGRTGTGASASTPSSGLVTLTGLTGMLAADVNRWMYLFNAPDPRENGAFEIMEWVSATSVKIRKANGIGATGTLSWEVHAYEGGDIIEVGGLQYHEGTIAAFARLHRSIVSSSWFKFRGIFPHNMINFVESEGNNAIVIRDPPRESPSGVWAKLRGTPLFLIDGVGTSLEGSPEKFDLDAFSRENTLVNGRVYTTEGRTLTDILAPASAEILDPADPNLVSFTSGYVQSITGRLAGTVVSAPSAGERAVWIPSHPRMGGKPALGMRVTGNRRLAGTLATPIPIGSYYGMFAILHLPSGYTSGGGAARGPILEAADGSFGMRIDIDGGSFGAGIAAGYVPVVGGGAVPQLALNGRKTVAILLQNRVETLGDPGSFQPTIVVDSPANRYAYGGVYALPAAVAVSKVYLCGLPGHGYVSNDIDISFVAFLKRPLTHAEELAAFRAADAYRVDKTGVGGALTSARTGTFTVDTLADAVIPVDVSGGAATANLPSGHRANDKVRFRLVGTTTSTLTIDPAGSEKIDNASTLVLSTSDPYAEITSDGTNWYRTGR